MKEIRTGSDFSGAGAFEQALKRNKIKHRNIFACDNDKFVRETYLANYEAPEEFPEDVYKREIPVESLDIYMTSPPCQGFSMAGRREGSILFFNSLEFIQKNNPRFFIFENVKGLLSHEKKDKDAEFGRTFNEWLNLLGGKSVNGLSVLFPCEGSVDYHIYWRVLNSKKYGVPQNRERVFIVGIRDDEDNFFTWPKEEYLTKKLIDILEDNVHKKHFLSDKAIKSILLNKDNLQASKVNPEIASTLQTPGNSCGIYKGMTAISILGYTRNSKGKVIKRHENQEAGTIHTATGGGGNTDQFVKIKSATKTGYEEAEKGDSIRLTQPNSKTRRGRVGNKVAQTIDTVSNQAIIQDKIRRLTPRECFRLQDFPDDFKFVVSDTQLYKQAGNSITVGVLAKIISKLPL